MDSIASRRDATRDRPDQKSGHLRHTQQGRTLATGGLVQHFPIDKEAGDVDADIHRNSPWTPHAAESMMDGRDVPDPIDVERLGRSFVRDLIVQRRWLTGRGIKHSFFIESPHVGGMDPWEDGIAMDPHWLYAAPDLGHCVICGAGESDGKPLNRCGRCGTAAYCSDTCQKKDWPVHKAICGMSLEDRGKALQLTKDGGLVHWATLDAAQESEEGEC